MKNCFKIDSSSGESEVDYFWTDHMVSIKVIVNDIDADTRNLLENLYSTKIKFNFITYIINLVMNRRLLLTSLAVGSVVISSRAE